MTHIHFHTKNIKEKEKRNKRTEIALNETFIYKGLL